ncbi:mannose-6-phosphate isomerase, class I [Metabacillus malikii]|uniref:Mannose-6-phosphate isomerase n=1 Tax=Metabacillus malikii TaxID=1504265 RepID=A0ABT9ZME9_9BACI|nr:mannose-6-phosphate isomerase, class I [Metabacillus malikii]MDQ0232385.1 mannose-6-phosphate isomerase [Metabacillus malikii]
MSKQPLFFNPIFKDRIWGGTKLTSFHYIIPTETTGECWAFAAHPNGQSVVKNGEFEGKTLGELWENHRHLFGQIEGDRFPLLTKILDANQDLSVQVHPNDDYAKVHENGELGKTECWYIVDCEEGAEIIYGHHAKTKDELVSMIENGDWDKLLRKVKIKPGDFFFVPSGTIHAIGAGTIILETQQNSDTTYRVFDFNRKDAEGNLRELHIEKSIEVTETPSSHTDVTPTTEQIDDAAITTYVQCPYFTVQKWSLSGSANLIQEKPFTLVSVIDGDGELTHDGNSYRFRKGDHILLPHEFGSYKLNGNAEFIASYL